ncbi:trypsin-like peptidase domain-containing protein [Streptomyces sp. NPDC089919]|uniref:S1C family serine protease n=1 Tax=Streptomyces sp. NPDC089919 TaxID=3155188 RepID=UPI00343E9E39
MSTSEDKQSPGTSEEPATGVRPPAAAPRPDSEGTEPASAGSTVSEEPASGPAGPQESAPEETASESAPVGSTASEETASGPTAPQETAPGWGDREGTAAGAAVPAAPPHRPAVKREFRIRHLAAAGAGIALCAGAVGGLAGSWSQGVQASLPLGSLSFGAPHAADPVPGVAAEALRSTVTIEATRPGTHSVGTGFFFDSAGRILTNAHVVDPDGKPATLTVTFSDGTTAPATTVGVAKGYDIAVIKIDGHHRTPRPLALGDSNRVRIGQPVIAAGAPFDLEGTVTSGILSAVDRPVTTQNGPSVTYLNALQTDAPINPGNSGGPLLDESGRVIGMNSAISAAAEPGGGPTGSVGLGFAIPVDQAKWVADELVAHGTAPYAQLGFLVNEDFDGKGVQIRPKPPKDGTPVLTAGGPAAEAGLQPGDVVTGLDGQVVTNGPALMSAVWSHRPHEKVELRYLRDGRPHTATVVLGERSEAV